MKRLGPFLVLLCLGACTYNAPPEVELVAPAQNRFVVGDPIRLRFSEPIRPASLEVRVWPGQKDLYDLEGVRKPEVQPLLDLCTVASSPCGKTAVGLSLVPDRTEARLIVPDGAFGPLGQPLVLEVTGRLADDSGHAKGVSRQFDFQIVAGTWDPYADVPADGKDAAEVAPDIPAPPLEIAEGAHLFFAQFTSPIELPQQFWCDFEVNPATGTFVVLMADADPLDDAPKNTSKPSELKWDNGPEGFLFTVRGKVSRDPKEGVVFETEPFTLALTIGPITFELRQAVMRGRVAVDPGTGLSRWDGTMAVQEVYYKVGDLEQTYPADQANFLITQLKPEEIPAGLPKVCEAEPCKKIGGKCDLLKDVTWPPEAVCGE